MKRRAYVLLLTLILGGLILLLLISIAPGAELNRFQNEREQRSEQSLGGRSGVGAALSALLYRSDFGLAGESITWRKKGLLTFDSKSKLRYSLNNTVGQAPATGWSNRIVPVGQVHLVGQHEGLVHQALVQPFSQVLVEDFNADGSNQTPRMQWLNYPGTSGFDCTRGYMFMGSPIYKHNQAQWLMVSGPLWTDYEMDVHVAYYGTTSFGFSLRTSDGFEGYRMTLQPMIAGQKVSGMDATVSAMVDAGRTEIPYPEADQHFDDPIFTVDQELTDQPAEWTFRVGISKDSMTLSVWDATQKKFKTLGTPWDLSKLSDDMVKAGYPKRFDSGGVGVSCQVATGVGFTNVVVNLTSSNMLRVHSRWED
ncbi:hypothetical protein JST97_21360 [bacterium]|nr:hypothetical protein [bacterium]